MRVCAQDVWCGMGIVSERHAHETQGRSETVSKGKILGTTYLMSESQRVNEGGEGGKENTPSHVWTLEQGRG